MPAALLTYVRLLQSGRLWLLRCLPEAQVVRIPGALRLNSSVRVFLRRHLVPHRMEWVPIQSGFGRGLWLRIDLADERNWWAGRHELEVQAELQRQLLPGIVMYDVGAHMSSTRFQLRGKERRSLPSSPIRRVRRGCALTRSAMAWQATFVWYRRPCGRKRTQR
jgi:hypothetical protein